MHKHKADLLAIERGLWLNHPRIAGIDEAGRGAWAGPVVAAAVIFEPEVMVPGVNDSKKLTPAKREKLYDDILANCVSFGIAAIDSHIIDSINILQATKQAMIQAVNSLLIVPDFLLVDGNAAIEHQIPQRTVIDGDALSHSIAAASILAKVYRDRLMCQYSKDFPQFGFEKHKGYGTSDHQAALREYGVLSIHRKSYGPIREIFTGKR